MMKTKVGMVVRRRWFCEVICCSVKRRNPKNGLFFFGIAQQEIFSLFVDHSFFFFSFVFDYYFFVSFALVLSSLSFPAVGTQQLRTKIKQT